MTKQPPPAIDPRQVEYLPLSEVIPDSRNPKAHHLETIDESIGRFGMLDLIVRDGRTGYIVSGHGRRKALSAMQERGETPPEGVKVDEAGGWLIPVVTGWASRTDSEAAAALIALNRTTELGGWVDDALLGLLDELSEEDDGFVGVGFGEDDLEALRALTEREDHAAPSLEDLEERYGAPTDEDALVTVSLRLPADLADRLSEALGDYDSEVEAVEAWLTGRSQ